MSVTFCGFDVISVQLRHIAGVSLHLKFIICHVVFV